MRRDARTQAKGPREFTVNIEWTDGRKVEDKGVYRVETDLWIDGKQYAITTYHVEGGPQNYILEDGVTIRFTEEGVNEETP